MKTTLHIVNGASLAGSLRGTGQVSDTAYWHESLYMGPLKLTDDVSFSKLRKEWWGLPPNWVLHLADRADIFPNLTTLLPRLKEYEKIVLWFEFDLFDQSMLWYILRVLHQHEDVPELFIISPDTFPGITDFRGMGQLHPEQLLLLLGSEQLLSAEQISEGARLWEIYARGDMKEIEQAVLRPSSLPYVQRALTMRLRQFPQQGAGLGDIQLFLMQIIDRLGSPLVYRVIGEAMATYHRDYGLNDLAAIDFLLELSEGSHRLVEFLLTGEVVNWDKKKIRQTSVRLSEVGRSLS